MKKSETIRKLRGFDITQKELAKKLGYTGNAYISKVENGKVEPSDEWMSKVEKAVKEIRAGKRLKATKQTK